MEDKNNKSEESRLDLEVYIMGEMKYELMFFLGECYKDNFCETLSWGNFRRFQLTLSNNKNWINIYFIILRNEMTADVLINTFKIYEKRNLTLLLYNTNDQKSKKLIENLQEILIFERNKFYEGILNDNSIKKNMKKLVDEDNQSHNEVDSDTLKENLKYLTDNESNLLFKIGFQANQTNKKTKNVKKNDTNSSYDIENNIFFIEEEQTNFNQLVCFLITENFNKLKYDEKKYENFIKVISENTKNKNKKLGRGKNSTINYIVKIIDWLIIGYILICFYKFLVKQN